VKCVTCMCVLIFLREDLAIAQKRSELCSIEVTVLICMILPYDGIHSLLEQSTDYVRVTTSA